MVGNGARRSRHLDERNESGLGNFSVWLLRKMMRAEARGPLLNSVGFNNGWEFVAATLQLETEVS
jgi:hypothetical protein